MTIELFHLIITTKIFLGSVKFYDIFTEVRIIFLIQKTGDLILTTQKKSFSWNCRLLFSFTSPNFFPFNRDRLDFFNIGEDRDVFFFKGIGLENTNIRDFHYIVCTLYKYGKMKIFVQIKAERNDGNLKLGIFYDFPYFYKKLFEERKFLWHYKEYGLNFIRFLI